MVKRYVPAFRYWMVVQRADQFDEPMPGPGLLRPQLKMSAGSIRVKTGTPCKSRLAKYDPVQLEPVSARAVWGGSESTTPTMLKMMHQTAMIRRNARWVMPYCSS